MNSQAYKRTILNQPKQAINVYNLDTLDVASYNYYPIKHGYKYNSDFFYINKFDY